MKEKEAKIKELRMMEAVKKDLMGLTGKIGVIAREMGYPIIDDSSSSIEVDGQMFGFTSTPMTDYYSNDIDYPDNILDALPTILETDELGNEVKSFEGDEWYKKKGDHRIYNPKLIGWMYNGLHKNINLDIQFLYDEGSLKVSWNGQKVFYENAGDLILYVPMEEWEKNINLLYETAKSKNKDRVIKEKENIKKKSNKLKSDFLNKLKKFWGV